VLFLQALAGSKGWTIKYYKGLGTSERDEAREYFSDLPKHRIGFKYRGEMDRKALELAFHKVVPSLQTKN
jgi:DNA topoisomerase-2